ncbi:DUF3040 domain-containing protein [Egicoccus sp. AB-alg6-2]|uniref:DUF3040 domain-containing protein n=1 Tax=Egicoccus sp. AB-alg6-2 TaxID=3242692 RepID=UPI00359CD599
MPLSEHEERILAEIERQLAAEDPRFVARARRRRTGPSRTLRLRLAVAMAVVGVLSLIGLTFNIAFGAVGMALLLGAILLGATAIRERPETPTPAPVPPDEAG